MSARPAVITSAGAGNKSSRRQDPFLLPCNCGRSNKQIYSDDHIFTGSNMTSTLLGTAAQFCASFYHVEPTPEGGIDELCLCVAQGGRPCPRKTVVAVARLQSTGSSPEDLYVARYSNCFKGSSESNVHAERFMLSDPGLARALKDSAVATSSGGSSSGGDGNPGGSRHNLPTRLLLYLTYQPCHHSGGHNRRGMGEHGTSCTELLCAYVHDVLAPLGIRLELRIAYLYRAHWETGAYDPKYAPAVQAARQGLVRLFQAGVVSTACSASDWEWLANQCDAAVRTAWREQAPPFGVAPRSCRAKMDAFVDSFLGKLSVDAIESAGMVANSGAAGAASTAKGGDYSGAVDGSDADVCPPCTPSPDDVAPGDAVELG